MKYKKVLAALITTGIIGMNFMPLSCFAATKNKLIKTQVSEYRFDYVNLEWWKGFNDEYLNEYIAKAIKNNQDLKIATLKVEQYNQMAKIQLANELPTASIGYAPSVVKMPGMSNTQGMVAFPMLMSYEADIFLKNRDKTRSAKKEWEASKYDERAAYISISSAVGATYFNVIKTDKLIELQKQIIVSRKQIFELMKERNSAGLTSTADMVRANKSYIASTADLIELEKTRDTLLGSLSVLIGENPSGGSNLKRENYKNTYMVKIPESIASDIIDQRPDYLRAEKMVEKAGIDVRVAKKEFLPSINIIGLLSFSSNHIGNAFNWSNSLGALGGGLMLPLFTGGRRVANLKLKKNTYEQILQNYYKTNLAAIQEVNDALMFLKQDDKKFKTNLDVYRLEEKDYKYHQEKYKTGLISNLDLIQRKENLLSLNKLVVQNKMDCNVDMISLYKATGAKI